MIRACLAKGCDAAIGPCNHWRGASRYALTLRGACCGEYAVQYESSPNFIMV